MACERPSAGMQSRSFVAVHVVARFCVTQDDWLPSSVVWADTALVLDTWTRVRREFMGPSVSAISGFRSTT